MRIDKIISGMEYRIDKQFQTLIIFGILIVFQIEKILKICYFSNSKNYKNFQFRKFRKIQCYSEN